MALFKSGKFLITLLALVGIFDGWFWGKDVSQLAIVLPAILVPYLTAKAVEDRNRRMLGEYKDGTDSSNNS